MREERESAVVICFLKKNQLLSSAAVFGLLSMDIPKFYKNRKNIDRPTDPVF